MKYKDFVSKFNLQEYVKANVPHDFRGANLYVSCPFHSESTSSCIIHERKFHCFGCGESGNSISFVMQVTGKTFREVIDANDVNDFLILNEHENAKQNQQPEAIISPSVIKNYNARLLRNPNKIHYLYSRGFDHDSIVKSQIGYGIPIDVHGRKFSHPRYSIPHYDVNGSLCGVKYRIDPVYANYEEEKYISHPGVSGKIYNVRDLLTHNDIIYVGSQFDAAVLSFRHSVGAVCPPSENSFRPEWIPMFSGKRVLIWLDNDVAGYTGALRVYRAIRNVCQAKIYAWDSSKYKVKEDFTDFLMREGIDGVRKTFENYFISI